MRTSRFTRALIGFAMLLTASAFAADKGSMQVRSPVMVGKIQLLVGDYTVQWEGTGPDVELTIKQDKKVKATVPAKLVPENSAFHQNATITIAESDGSRKLIAIQLSGKRFTLQIESQSDVLGAGRNDPDSW
jgi:hypothetical protein